LSRFSGIHRIFILSHLTRFAIVPADTVRKDRLIPSAWTIANDREKPILGSTVLEAVNMNKRISKIIDLVFKGIALAMGVAVVVTSILGVMEAKEQVMLLGIGLFCLAITSLDKE
jgi:hypothetical protein